MSSSVLMCSIKEAYGRWLPVFLVQRCVGRVAWGGHGVGGCEIRSSWNLTWLGRLSVQQGRMTRPGCPRNNTGAGLLTQHEQEAGLSKRVAPPTFNNHIDLRCIPACPCFFLWVAGYLRHPWPPIVAVRVSEPSIHAHECRHAAAGAPLFRAGIRALSGMGGHPRPAESMGASRGGAERRCGS